MVQGRIRRLFNIKRTLKWFSTILVILESRIKQIPIILFHVPHAGLEYFISPVINELKKRPEPALILILLGNKEILAASDIAQKTGLPQRRVLEWDLAGWLGKYDAYVSPTQWSKPPGRPGCSICMFHGQPTKGNTFVSDLMKNFDTLFLLGPLQRQVYEEWATKFPDDAKGITALDVGYPKSDILVNKVLTAPIDKRGSNVLFAPAFDKGTSLEIYGEELIETILNCNVQLNVKLHPMQYNPPYYPHGINWPERMRKFSARSNFFEAGNIAIEPLLLEADVLITDVSGVAFEFILLDKPVIFLHCPAFFVKTLGSGRYLRRGDEVINDIRFNAGRSAGLVVHNLQDLPDAIERSLKFPEEFAKQRESVRSMLLYNPGKGAEVAADVILQLCARPSRNANSTTARVVASQG